MKRALAAGILLAFPLWAGAAGPAAPRSSALTDAGSGCGLGSLLFDGNAGVGAHSVAMTTNGFLFNNTFGMSSGTLGCDSSQPVRYKGERLYISANMTKLAQDMSRGGGETLAGLAELMGVAESDKAAFYALARTHFESIYAHESVTSDQVTDALVGLMKADTVLAKYVS
ncbi:DUF3015 family protein [Methylococcus sp. EFPC2]|uniref:DUF3015 family protein n=1 Tax=Methylococcus sp. EFPC2 TaxID=2812648 RepID=UPI001967A4D0|nr:DUF3015 family protein [Methylococcus sp. EFPC2]QSA97200.1 DUF3015 family protein [Methylococcus sp. EFPC2]